MQLRITNGFEGLSDANLVVRSNQIVADLTANFTAPPGLSSLTNAKDAFETALTAAKEGGKYEVAIKKQRRDELIDQLHLMGNWVLYTCAGDRAMAISSGFSIAKEPTPAPQVAKAENQKLVDGVNSGELKYSFEKVPGARSYLYQATPDPITSNSVWSNEMGTRRRFTFSGLDSGKRYWVRVAAVGSTGLSAYSDPVSRVVQ